MSSILNTICPYCYMAKDDCMCSPTQNLKQQLAECEKQVVLLRDAIKKYLSDNDPEGFGCACLPNHLCGPCRAARRQRPLYEALAATEPKT